MTTEIQQQIEQYKGQNNKGVANELKRLAQQLEGAPKTTDCFCSSIAWQNYITQFYTWYDNEYNKQITNE